MGDEELLRNEAGKGMQFKANEATKTEERITDRLQRRWKQAEELRALAAKARAEAETVAVQSEGFQGQKTCEERRQEEEDRKRRLEDTRAKDPCVSESERVIAGMTSVWTGIGEPLRHDERLFNQEKGIVRGCSADDQYNVDDKGLFGSHGAQSALCQPKKDLDLDLDLVAEIDRRWIDDGLTSVWTRIGEPLTYDERLLNQETRIGAGCSADDQCNVDDKGLFGSQGAQSTVCQPKKDLDLVAEIDRRWIDGFNTMRNTNRSKPDKEVVEVEEKSEDDGPLSCISVLLK